MAKIDLLRVSGMNI